MREFVDNDAGYLEWVAANSDGYVLNVPRVNTGYPNRLHKASCGTIRTPTRTNYTTNQYKKFCSRDHAELEAWARSDAYGFETCGICKP